MYWIADEVEYREVSMDAAYSGSTLIWRKMTDDDYLTFTVVSGGTINWGYDGDSGTPKTIYYKKNNGQWTELVPTPYPGTQINVASGDVVRFKGVNDRYCGVYPTPGTTTTEYKRDNRFTTSSAKYNLSGNILSMTYGDTCIYQTKTSSTPWSLAFLFFDCDSIEDASQLQFPASSLTNSCYSYMFYGSSIKQAPNILPATKLADQCYSNMFRDCSSLVNAPQLPATSLTSTFSCYSGMFQNCGSLTTAPELPATKLGSYCYAEMFYNCRSLTTTPDLPATTLAGDCYRWMFAYCSGITSTTQTLPATTLANSCYQGMYYQCKSLTTAPVLPAPTVNEISYLNMFYGCSSLNYIKCLATNISAYNATGSWTSGVSGHGTFVKASSMNNWTTGINGIPSGWTVQNA